MKRSSLQLCIVAFVVLVVVLALLAALLRGPRAPRPVAVQYVPVATAPHSVIQSHTVVYERQAAPARSWTVIRARTPRQAAPVNLRKASSRPVPSVPKLAKPAAASAPRPNTFRSSSASRSGSGLSGGSMGGRRR